MYQIAARCILVTLAVVVLPFHSSFAGELDKQIQFLKPLLGKKWVGGFVGSDAPDIRIELHFEAILDGKAVSYDREAEAADFTAVTHFYWIPGRNEVCFVSLNNRGIVEEGIVLEEDGKITLSGKSYRPDSTTEFKTTLEITADGVLRDTFMRMEEGKWIRGHIQEFVAEE